MKLYRVTWYLGNGWTITGRLYAKDQRHAAEQARRRVKNEAPHWDLGEPEVSDPICEVFDGGSVFPEVARAAADR